VFSPVIALAFSGTQYDECRQFLTERAANTECVPVVDEAQLALAADGRLVESGYRFNAIGFEAVSRALCPGLTALFNDLSGENYPRSMRAERPASLPAAVGIYNAALRVRFDALRERSLLVNHQEHSVDGFLGLEHRFFDNSVFFDLVARILFEFQPHAEFSRAEIIGRELRLFFILPETRRQDIHPDAQHSFAAGWYFSNREDAGNAIRAAHCIFTRFGPAVAASTSMTKVVHAGSDVIGRTSAMLSRVVATYPNMDLIAARVQALLGTPLGLSQVKSENDAVQKKWVRYLTRFRLNASVAQIIVKNAATVGADIAPRDPIAVYSGAGLSSRTGYDLLCALLRHARQEYATYRDALQATAMCWLTSADDSLKKKYDFTYGGDSDGKKRIDRRVGR
jgi:hypothetical protein